MSLDTIEEKVEENQLCIEGKLNVRKEVKKNLIEKKVQEVIIPYNNQVWMQSVVASNSMMAGCFEDYSQECSSNFDYHKNTQRESKNISKYTGLALAFEDYT